MIALKILGSIVTVFAFMQFGIYKSTSYAKKRDILQKICIALENLSIEIRLKRGELYILFEKLFCNEYISFSDRRFVISEKYIDKVQIDKLNELSLALGKSDAKGECEIIGLYQSIFADYLTEAEKEYKTNLKIWNTLSLGGGLTVVLLLF